MLEQNLNHGLLLCPQGARISLTKRQKIWSICAPSRHNNNPQLLVFPNRSPDLALDNHGQMSENQAN
jgi:hypothetical protein